MALRYKGIPDRGANKQADDLPPLCFCRFMGVGQPLDGWECDVHGVNKFGCDHCYTVRYLPCIPRCGIQMLCRMVGRRHKRLTQTARKMQAMRGTTKDYGYVYS